MLSITTTFYVISVTPIIYVLTRLYVYKNQIAKLPNCNAFASNISSLAEHVKKSGAYGPVPQSHLRKSSIRFEVYSYSDPKFCFQLSHLWFEYLNAAEDDKPFEIMGRFEINGKKFYEYLSWLRRVNILHWFNSEVCLRFTSDTRRFLSASRRIYWE